MYSLKDTKKIYNLAKVERKLGVEFGELSDIWDYLMLIFSKTAFFKNILTAVDKSSPSFSNISEACFFSSSSTLTCKTPIFSHPFYAFFVFSGISIVITK